MSVHKLKTHKNCHDYHCPICMGDLAICEVCNGAEASLPTDCPGVKMSPTVETAVQAGALDFVNGQWLLTEASEDGMVRKLPLFKCNFKDGDYEDPDVVALSYGCPSQYLERLNAALARHNVNLTEIDDGGGELHVKVTSSKTLVSVSDEMVHKSGEHLA